MYCTCYVIMKRLMPSVHLGQRSHAASLAEKYHDFGVLIELCESADHQGTLQQYMTRFTEEVIVIELVAITCQNCFVSQEASTFSVSLLVVLGCLIFFLCESVFLIDSQTLVFGFVFGPRHPSTICSECVLICMIRFSWLVTGISSNISI